MEPTLTHFAGDPILDMALRNYMFWCLVIMTVVCSCICLWNWLGWKRDRKTRKGEL